MLYDPSFDYAARTAQLHATLDASNAVWAKYDHLSWKERTQVPAYKALVAEYWQLREVSFPVDFWADLRRLRQADVSPELLENAVQFLEVAPPIFKAYWVYATISRVIRRAPLTDDQRHRLQRAILRLVDTEYRRMFRNYTRLAIKLNDDEFQAAIEARLTSLDSHVRRRAEWVMKALENSKN